MSFGSPRYRSFPLVEPLENRETPAMGISLGPGGVLRLEGSPGNDFFRLAPQVQDNPASAIQVQLTSDSGYTTTKTFPRSQVQSIAVMGKGGQDYLQNSTGLPTTTSTTSSGQIKTRLDSPPPANPEGVFVVGPGGTIGVDYLFRGQVFNSEVGIFSLKGMETLVPGSLPFIKEAARRVLSDSNSGHLLIQTAKDGARFSANTAWESNKNINAANYAGGKTFRMEPGDKCVVMLIPNGKFTDVTNARTTKLAWSVQPLFSWNPANPVPAKPQFARLDECDNVYSFEDLRFDSKSDADFNDVVFQLEGMRGTVAPLKNLINKDRNFLETAVVRDRILPQSEDTTAAFEKDHGPNEDFLGKLGKGTFSVTSSGMVQIDFLYDGGGYVGQMGIYSLEGMTDLAPGSAEYIREACRRSLSQSEEGYLVIDDFADAAKHSEKLLTDGLFNNGEYKGKQAFQMCKNRKFGLVLIPNATLWEAYSNPNSTGAKRALFSNAKANPTQTINGGAQLADTTDEDTVFGWEDQRLDGDGKSSPVSDRDYNDIIFRLIGAESNAVNYKTVANSAKSILKDPAYPAIIA